MEIFIIIVIAAFILTIAQNANKAAKTGSYKQANTSRGVRQKCREKMKIQNQYGLEASYNPNNKHYESYQKEINAHEERWASPGTQAGKEVDEKTKRWDAGERW
jgi:hypothetical protein